MPIIVTGERRKDRFTVEPAALRLPYIGVQAPTPTTDYDDVATLTGLKPAAVGVYNSIETSSGYISFPTSTYNDLADRGVGVIAHTVQVQSTGIAGFDATNAPRYNAPAILGGTHDDFFKSWYDAKATWMAAHPGIECEERVAHEADGNWYPWGWQNGNNGNTPALVGQAFAHIDAIRQQHCPGVVLSWCPDAYSSFTNGADIDTAWANGANVAKLIQWDGYNWGPSSLGAHGWRSLATIFAASRAWAEAKGLPWGIAETGCPFAPPGSFADGTGDKGQWWRDAAVEMKSWGGHFRGFYQEQNSNKGNPPCRINRLRHGDYQFPAGNSYGATSGVTYTDHSADDFAAAFAAW